ncbi:hypothetical protein [Curtobacterium luteum]|uniref:Uncharacterized protein n=1 Tax=Curtobacterium luteum TaxID=33881 RepID=A0A175RLD8_9MICO|nr:hypothetical protein [Curtobacterium luteum]KTR03629.1 hypothetical protein NS184_13490 [Curtobacterium luteum]
MDRLNRLPLPVLLPIMFVVVGGVYFGIGFLTDPTRVNVGARLVGALFSAVTMTVVFGIVIGVRRRRAGGADAVTDMQKTMRTGVVPDDVDTGRWTSELERYQRQWLRNRWLAPVVFGLFSVLSVVMAVSAGPVWLLFLVFFLGFLVFTMWQTRRGLRNTERALAELGRRRPSAGAPAAATPGATWTLPTGPDVPGHDR